MTLKDSRYTLVKQIARGGMAEIYLAVQIGRDGFQRILAIKRILPHYVNEHEFVEMFRDEAHIGKRLQHANIVKVEGFEEVEGAPAIIMEFIDGADLRTLLGACAKSGSRLTVPMAVFIIAECARGLHYAHTKVDEITNRPLEIVHRDISPQNVLISYEGEIKVTDFGIAHAETKNTDTKPGVVKGKYSYMSPEQISGKEVDSRTDIFALCIVLWEVLAMQRLFSAENEAMIIQMVRNCEIPQNLMELNPSVDSELAALVQKGLQKDRKNRFQSAEELERRLRIYLNKNFPGFSPTVLATLLKDVLSKKRTEIQSEIKQALTKTNQKPMNRQELPRFSPQANPAPQHNSQQMVKSPAATATPIKLASATSKSTQKKFSGAGSHSIHPKMDLPRSHRKHPGSRGRSSNIMTQLLLLMLLGGGFVGFDYWQKFQARSSITSFTISTLPRTVRIKIDGNWLENGEYVKTPYTIGELSRGRHELNLYRMGYSPLKYNFTVKSSKALSKDNFILKSKSRLTAAKFVLDSNEGSLKDKVHLSVENGRDSGKLPLYVNDLRYGQAHKVTVYPDFAGNPQQSFECTIKSEAADAQHPQIIVISPTKKSCIEAK